MPKPPDLRTVQNSQNELFILSFRLTPPLLLPLLFVGWPGSFILYIIVLVMHSVIPPHASSAAASAFCCPSPPPSILALLFPSLDSYPIGSPLMRSLFHSCVYVEPPI